MRSHPPGNIDSSLILLCELVCGRYVPYNISIRCDAAGDFFCFVSNYFFRQLLIPLYIAHQRLILLKVNQISVWTWCVKNTWSVSFSLQPLVLFFNNFRFMPESFTTRQNQYEQIFLHWAKGQISCQKESSHAGYLIDSTEIETLFLAFSPRSFRCFKLSK